MAAIGWISSIVLLAVNVHAVIALSTVRGADKATLLRLKWRCLGSVLIVVSLGAVVVVIGVVAIPPSHGGADRARFLGNVISEALNTAAFSVVASLLPLAAGLLASARARRAT